MSSLLFINAFFERELLSSSPTKNPFSLLQQHPLYMQLQYLSCLIADPQEIPLVSHLPEDGYLDRLKSFGITVKDLALPTTSFAKQTSIHSWGASSSLAAWAKQKGYCYKTPHLDVVKKVHSKEFAFLSAPHFEHSCLITTPSQLTKWWGSFNGPKVLKTLYGSSGRGHFISVEDLDDLPKALLFLEKQKTQSPSLVAQAWVNRVLDFSTQWNIQEDGSYTYLGATICENSSKGIYQKSIVGPEELLFKEHLPFLIEHKNYVEKVIQKMSSLRFFGNVGFDAMLYKHNENQKTTLHPLLEINARKTMGWVALKLHQKLAREHLLSISYQSASKELNWLPNFIIDSKGAPLFFSKQLLVKTASPTL